MLLPSHVRRFLMIASVFFASLKNYKQAIILLLATIPLISEVRPMFRPRTRKILGDILS